MFGFVVASRENRWHTHIVLQSVTKRDLPLAVTWESIVAVERTAQKESTGQEERAGPIESTGARERAAAPESTRSSRAFYHQP